MNDLIEQKNELMEVLGATSVEVKNWDDIVTTDTITYPIADIATLGSAFSGISAVLDGASKLVGNKQLYEAIIPNNGSYMVGSKDGSGLLGTLVKDGEGIVGQARFKEAGTAVKAAQNAGAMSQFFMSMAIMAINQSLKNIAENQKQILSFLEIDKQTQLKGDMITLSNIINEYQHNWNNAQFLSNREMQVLDIKRSAEQNILFYREMIEKKLGKQKFISVDTSKKLSEVQSDFKYYQLSLYQYAFASFLDAMLLENFEKEYLHSVSHKIQDYSSDYTAFFEKSIADIEKLAGTSVQSRALQGLSIAGKFVGKQIARIPDKDNKIKIDDKLIAGSGKLDGIHDKSISDTKEQFSVVHDSGIIMFIDKINLINAMHNEPLKVAVGNDQIYLSVCN